MSRHCIWLAVATTATVLCCNADAKQERWPQGVSKGTTLVVKVPLLKFTPEGRSMTGAGIFGIDVERVLSQPNWNARFFPLMEEFVVEKIGDWKSPTGVTYVQIEVRSAAAWIKLRFDPARNLDSRFREVASIGGLGAFKEGAYFRNEVFGPIAATIFVGPLAGLPYDLKLALLQFVDFREDAIKAETYKGKSFISVNIANDDVFNELRLDQAARVARVINDKMLGLLKTFAPVAEVAGIDGIKLVAVIKHKSFLDELAPPTEDRMELYVSLDKAQQFKNAEMTSQQLMDASVVLLNGNRIEAVLSSGAR